MTDDDEPKPKKAKKPPYQPPVRNLPRRCDTGVRNHDGSCLACDATERQKCKKP